MFHVKQHKSKGKKAVENIKFKSNGPKEDREKERSLKYKEAERKKPDNETLILAIINQKGGVGKSTTAVNLSACLGELGYKVLLVDLDPQGNSSSGLGFDKTSCEFCSYDCLLNDDVKTENVIQSVKSSNVWLIPATINLAGAEAELVQVIARESRLKDSLEQVDGEFDFILIDCPPSLGLLTVNALTAANNIIIPIQCEFYALEGLSKIIDTTNMVKKRLNPALDIFGVVITMYDNRTSLAKQVSDEVYGFFKDKVFDTKIPRTVRISEAPGFGLPINEYDPNGKGTKAYRALTKEVVKRYKNLNKQESEK